MSSQKGNSQRTRPQKHKNRTAFRNNLHDTSNRTKLINNIQVHDVCVRCKEIIEWKIKYKKYKPLSQPKKCVKCDQKTVKKAYHVMCTECGRTLGVCTKCCQSKEIVPAKPTQQEELQLNNEMKNMLESLPERKRRTFLRYMNKKDKEEPEENQTNDEKQTDLMAKLVTLTLEEGDDGDDDDSDCFDAESLDSNALDSDNN